MSHDESSQAFLGLTADIISAHVKNSQVDAADLPLLIERVYLALRHAGAPAQAAQPPAQAAAPPEPDRPAPAVSIKKSIFADYIICLEDGRKMKTLKRYLRTTYNMTPEQYREKWGLAPDYPMVAPSYAEHRSALAKQTGLGRKPIAAMLVQPAPEASAPPPSPAEPPAPLGRTDHTLASVFSNFPQQAEDEQDSAEASAEAELRKPRRKPFSKQLARGMRR